MIRTQRKSPLYRCLHTTVINFHKLTQVIQLSCLILVNSSLFEEHNNLESVYITSIQNTPKCVKKRDWRLFSSHFSVFYTPVINASHLLLARALCPGEYSFGFVGSPMVVATKLNTNELCQFSPNVHACS